MPTESRISRIQGAVVPENSETLYNRREKGTPSCTRLIGTKLILAVDARVRQPQPMPSQLHLGATTWNKSDSQTFPISTGTAAGRRNLARPDPSFRPNGRAGSRDAGLCLSPPVYVGLRLMNRVVEFLTLRKCPGPFALAAILTPTAALLVVGGDVARAQTTFDYDVDDDSLIEADQQFHSPSSGQNVDEQSS